MKKILVVDDEPQVRAIVAEYLRITGFEVLEAENGEEALAMFSPESVGFVISDVRMPLMNGLQLLKAIKSISNDIPVVLMTAYQPTQAQESAMSVKADGYLLKPFPLMRLKELIDRYLAK